MRLEPAAPGEWPTIRFREGAACSPQGGPISHSGGRRRGTNGVDLRPAQCWGPLSVEGDFRMAWSGVSSSSVLEQQDRCGLAGRRTSSAAMLSGRQFSVEGVGERIAVRLVGSLGLPWLKLPQSGHNDSVGAARSVPRRPGSARRTVANHVSQHHGRARGCRALLDAANMTPLGTGVSVPFLQQGTSACGNPGAAVRVAPEVDAPVVVGVDRSRRRFVPRPGCPPTRSRLVPELVPTCRLAARSGPGDLATSRGRDEGQ
jgi:hypothetical protein